MVSGGSSFNGEGFEHEANFTRGSRSWIDQGPSISTGSSTGGGSPSSWSHPAVPVTPGGDTAVPQFDRLDIHGDGDPEASNVRRKKKRGSRAVVGEKSGRGLRQFSMRVCEKVESKGRTTYNEVADELVAEFSNPSNIESPDQFEEKNIRRRVYDALNVLMAMDIISKDKKEIQWKGLPHTCTSDVEELKAECNALKGRIEKKAAHLQELEEQLAGLQNLVQRNEQRNGLDNSTSASGVSLPFILVQTRPHATVEVEISEDMQLVHCDFNSTPFELHDDAYVLKAMGLCGAPSGDRPHQIPIGHNVECSNILGSLVPTAATRLSSTAPSVPSILKGRLKHEPYA